MNKLLPVLKVLVLEQKGPLVKGEVVGQKIKLKRERD